MSESTRSRDECDMDDLPPIDDLPPLLLISPIRSQSLWSWESSSESEDEDSESSLSLSDSSDPASSAMAPAVWSDNFSVTTEPFSTLSLFSRN